MKFIDSASIEVVAGNGGAGCLSFHRARFIPKGGPDGGDGGDGGSVIIEGEPNLNTLSEFRVKRLFCAENGAPGRSQKRRGKSATNLIIHVPLGTSIYNTKTNELIAEVLTPKQKIIVAKGGFHGLGNARFKSSINRTPYQFSKGKHGEKRMLNLEMSLLADVGLLGFPNAGKSSFLRKVSSAKPKVANYPFTTLYPNLGVVSVNEIEHLVIADIPGIIDGASHNAGLGLKFLKHLARTKLLLHIVDIAPVDYSNPADNYKKIEQELKNYSEVLYKKPRLVALNKIDLLTPNEKKNHIKQFIRESGFTGELHKICTLTGAGCRYLVSQLNTHIKAKLK